MNPSPSLAYYRRLYDRMAPFYATGMRLLPVWRRYTEAVLPWLPGGEQALEIGPGPGLLLDQLSHRYRLAAGFDLSPGMLSQARSACAGGGIGAGKHRSPTVCRRRLRRHHPHLRAQRYP